MPGMADKANVGAGWQPIIESLEHDLTALLGEGGWEVVQIKEKFGGLRYYMGIPPEVEAVKREEAYHLCNEAEELSYHHCEVCGEAADVSTQGGWFVTLCEKHKAERLVARAEQNARFASEKD